MAGDPSPYSHFDGMYWPITTGRIYLGGPVDYAGHDIPEAWQHYPAWSRMGDPYCPRCRCVGMADESIISANYAALMSAEVAILDLRTHSIGTPIEMYWRVWQAERKTVLIVKEGSVFVRETHRRFGRRVRLTDHPTQTVEIVENMLNG